MVSLSALLTAWPEAVQRTGAHLLREMLAHVGFKCAGNDSQSDLSHRQGFPELPWKWRERRILCLLFFLISCPVPAPGDKPEISQGCCSGQHPAIQRRTWPQISPAPPLLSCCISLMRTHLADVEKHFFPAALPAAAFVHSPTIHVTTLNVFSNTGYAPPTNHDEEFQRRGIPSRLFSKSLLKMD